ncbi:hypothetical protein I302_100822 [Kwoniella bestiolae CBS 10118]|uniref:Exoribonuclease phosphorolytic domain-containing protein n=1 Tax=Kwoniella bestiolae CBS 10118 TaxID=1296100 RepID=A0A1B9G650_9TREE|nr:hypothetical protein I302_04195 [Kwoniella bestiolae CBS 10118]OCF26509.1 hypothetical protein I302_04195 [Kwoniella bestiolae CBS 10118]
MSSAGPSRRRLDGRKPHEIRPLTIEIGELDRADGSGRFGFGSTSALASCSGPLEVRLNKELPTRATLEISHRPLEGVGATPSRALITTLESIFPSSLRLSLYPRSLIQIIVQSLSSSSSSSSYKDTSYDTPQVYIDIDPSSSELIQKNVWPQPQSQVTEEGEGTSPNTSYPFSSRCASINAATLAVLDAGSIAMTSLPIAISIIDLSNDRGLIVDPSIEEESNSVARFGFGWSFGRNVSLRERQEGEMDVEDEGEEMELSWVESEGKFNKEKFSDALELSKIACRQILQEIRQKLSAKLESKRLQ